MSYKILTQIVEQDAKGKIGSGTQYNLDILLNGEMVESHHYSTMDVLVGKFDPNPIIRKYRKLNDEYFERMAKEREQSIKQAKMDELANKMKKVESPLIAAIDAVIASNPSLTQQYMDGNQKAINALVGQTMRHYKADPAIIKQLLVEKMQ